VVITQVQTMFSDDFLIICLPHLLLPSWAVSRLDEEGGTLFNKFWAHFFFPFHMRRCLELFRFFVDLIIFFGCSRTFPVAAERLGNLPSIRSIAMAPVKPEAGQ
jgi:hypothetical protein